jgi:hypothetical protein
MANAQRRRSVAGRIIGLGHLLTGGAALVFAGALVVAGWSPMAELEGVLLPLGLLLALVAGVFVYTAAIVLRRAPDERRGPALVLSTVELLVGAALAVGVMNGRAGSPADFPGPPPNAHGPDVEWSDPIFVSSVLLVVLGLAGLGLEVASRRAARP